MGTIENFILDGQSTGNEVTLRSSTADTPWQIVVDGTYSLDYVDVKDSYACGGATIDATIGTGNVNSGGNSCWDFPGVAIVISGTFYTDEGVTEYTTAGETISLRVNGDVSYSTTTIAGTGEWQFTSVEDKDLVPGVPILIWLDDASVFASLFTKASTTHEGTGLGLTGLDLYQNRVNHLAVRPPSDSV